RSQPARRHLEPVRLSRMHALPRHPVCEQRHPAAPLESKCRSARLHSVHERGTVPPRVFGTAPKSKISSIVPRLRRLARRPVPPVITHVSKISAAVPVLRINTQRRTCIVSVLPSGQVHVRL